MTIQNNEMVADNGKAIKRKKDTTYFERCTLLAGETASDFDEIDIDEARRINEEQEKRDLPMEGAAE